MLSKQGEERKRKSPAKGKKAGPVAAEAIEAANNIIDEGGVPSAKPFI
jgi:hypothetical protein